MGHGLEVNKVYYEVADMAVDMEVDKVANMAADMEVDKVDRLGQLGYLALHGNRAVFCNKPFFTISIYFHLFRHSWF